MTDKAFSFPEKVGAGFKSIFSTSSTECYQIPNTDLPENETESKEQVQIELSSQKKLKEELFGTAEIKVEQDFEDAYYDHVEIKQEPFQEDYESAEVEELEQNEENDIFEEKIRKELHKGETNRNPKLKDKYPCESCAQAFANESELHRHALSFCFRCIFCWKHFPNRRIMRRHSREHESKNFKCYLCDKSFVNPRYLKNHMKQHEGPRFFCNQCPKDFCSNQSLKQHKKSHEDIRYFCNKCPQTFTLVNNLKRHLKIHDGHKYYCPKCPKVFSLECSLKKHMKNHSGIRFYCSQCSRSYLEKTGLTQHLKIHEGVRYNCSQCPMEFIYRNQLTRHMIMKHNENENEIIALD